MRVVEKAKVYNRRTILLEEKFNLANNIFGLTSEIPIKQS